MSEKPTTLTMKKGQFYTFLTWLNVPLHSEKARARNRVLKIIEPIYDEYMGQRLALLKTHCEVDEQGNLVKQADGKSAIFLSTEKEAEYDVLFDALKLEPVTFDISDTKVRADWKVARDVFEATPAAMDVITTQYFEDVLEELSVL